MSELPFPEPDGTVPEISPETLRAQIDAGEQVVVLDARNGTDYEAWHIDGPTVESHNIPYFSFIDGVDSETIEPLPAAEEIVVVCAKGKASAFVAERLADLGYETSQLTDGMRGWAGLYDRNEVTAYDGTGALYQYHRPSSGCLSYMLISDGEALVVDPLAAFTDRYERDAAALDSDLRYAVDTHIHADHISGLRELGADGVTALLPDAAYDRGVENADDLGVVSDGETLSVGGATVAALHTPGHTTGMTSFVLDGAAILTGDGLFTESVARPDLEDGAEGATDAARRLHESLHERVFPLGEDLLVAGGHTSDAAAPAADGTYSATVGELRARMPALSLDIDEFVEEVVEDMPPRPANYEAIIDVNLGRSTVDDSALTLELGPNNCAASGEAMTSD